LGGVGKNAYLSALTRELDSPRSHPLDAYLLPLVQPLQSRQSWIEEVRELPGLDGSIEDINTDVSYDNEDPVGERRYRAKLQSRQCTIPNARK